MPRLARRAVVIAGLSLPALIRRAHAGWTPSGGRIRLIVPFAEGGTNDEVMRALAAGAAARLGAEVEVRNLPSRSGVAALVKLSEAPPDGLLLGQLPAGALRAMLLERLAFDIRHDITPILGVAGSAFGAIARKDRFPDGWAGFLREAREKPGELSYGSGGVNSTGHLTIARLLLRERVRAVHIPFRGAMLAAEALVTEGVDIVGGTVRIGEFVDDGRASWLNVWSRDRLPRWPDAPTLRELGYRLVVTQPFGIVGPPNMPAEPVAAVHDAFLAALRDPSFATVLSDHDMTEDYRDGATYADFLAETTRREQMLIDRLGLLP